MFWTFSFGSLCNMSFEKVQSQGAQPTYGQTQPDQLSIETNTRPSTYNTNSTTDSLFLDDTNEDSLTSTFQEDLANPTTLGPLEKEIPPHGQSSPAAEESLEQRLERLGRQRPEIFGSLWAEIGFVFSISMSQVLSVIASSSNLEL